MKITIFGSCRQDTIHNIPGVNVTGIKENISYTHYTKEILEVINFCKNGHLTPEETIFTFRTPILKNAKLYFNNILKQNFETTDIFIIEVASRITYEYNGKYVHHILYDDTNYNNKYKDNINVSVQSNEEIENDIIQIKKELNKPIIIVSHIVTYEDSSRYELTELLENICLKHNILFINPVKEMKKCGHNNILNLIEDEKVIAHYNNLGHSIIQNIYNDFIKKSICDVNYLRIYNTSYNKIRIGSINDGGYVIADGLSYDILLSCGISDDVTFENFFIEKYNKICYAFDGTIDTLPSNANSNITFIKKNIANTETDKTTNLLNYIENNDNIFLKMDIETNEFQWLEIVEKKHLQKCNQIIIEFHFVYQDNEYVNELFNNLSFPISVNRRINCLKKLEETHYLIHLHPNNCCGTTMFNDIEIPNVFECTYIRKDLCKNIQYSSNQIPDTLLDAKNIINNEDIYLIGYPFVSEL